MRRFRGTAVGLAVLIAVGCALAATGRGAAADSSTIVYTRTGGIAYMIVRLVVTSDGEAVLTRQFGHQHTTWQRRLSPTLEARLLRLVRAAYRLKLQAHYRACGLVADGIVEQLTFNGRTVKVDQDAFPPIALARALAALAVVTTTWKQP